MYYQEPAIRFEKQSYKIIKTSCGPGFAMVLDAYGAVWVFGKNQCGQLGIKNDIVIEDPIKTSECLASFAIDSNGTLYKWGVNQFHSTNQPIYDRFGKLINYSLENHIEEQWVPLQLK
jgi:alpha-tubulin suppressor-like RCC1 family protein